MRLVLRTTQFIVVEIVQQHVMKSVRVSGLFSLIFDRFHNENSLISIKHLFTSNIADLRGERGSILIKKQMYFFKKNHILQTYTTSVLYTS